MKSDAVKIGELLPRIMTEIELRRRRIFEAVEDYQRNKVKRTRISVAKNQHSFLRRKQNGKNKSGIRV